MSEQANLPEMLRILWATRIDATANRWHVTRRVIPPLKTLAEAGNDPRLRKAAEQAVAAIDQLDTMVESLRTVIDYLQPNNHQPA
ncbi:hypothetical protein [Labedaea rhizosphaerae]|uniref:Uncharacterized protein n=1 Tax=Labedaea rhizosphaerae TaxID=598644 RepID=A0A4R6SJ86_LABRH|nr:hypothetical protein [Labedaea rhizosphaerae]TDQ04108.1 hypothetical protein EV186_10149 [Labedaea rhizosphaerae]